MLVVLGGSNPLLAEVSRDLRTRGLSSVCAVRRVFFGSSQVVIVLCLIETWGEWAR